VTWIDGTYVQNAIGSDQGYSLGLLTTSTGTTTTDRFTQYELLSRSRVIACLQFAGYPAPSATLTTPADTADPVNVTNAFLRQMQAAVLFNDCYALVPGIELPKTTLNAIATGVAMLDAVYSKRLPVPGLTATAMDGYGGSKFNTTANTYPPIVTEPIFRRLRGSGF